MYLLCHVCVYLICLCNNLLSLFVSVILIHFDVLSVRFIQFLTQ